MRLPHWGRVARIIADYDPERLECVIDWPLRDLLVAYLARLERERREQHRWEQLLWAVMARHLQTTAKPPTPPAEDED